MMPPRSAKSWPLGVKQPFFIWDMAGNPHSASMSGQTFPVSHSSLISETDADTNRISDASFGNIVASRVRRLISLFICSRPLIVRSHLRGEAGS